MALVASSIFAAKSFTWSSTCDMSSILSRIRVWFVRILRWQRSSFSRTAHSTRIYPHLPSLTAVFRLWQRLQIACQFDCFQKSPASPL
jgi:hypothetical protein